MNSLMKTCVMGAAALALAQNTNAAVEIFNMNFRTDSTEQITPTPSVKATLTEVSGGIQVDLVYNNLPADVKVQSFYFNLIDPEPALSDLESSLGKFKNNGGNLQGGYQFDYEIQFTKDNTPVTSFTISPKTGTLPLTSFYELVKKQDTDASGYFMGIHLGNIPEISSIALGASTHNGPGTTPVPEPSTYFAGLSALGMLFLGFKNRK